MVYTQIKTYRIMGKDYVSANVAYCTKQNSRYLWIYTAQND